jgi:hypothetical protein
VSWKQAFIDRQHLVGVDDCARDMLRYAPDTRRLLGSMK